MATKSQLQVGQHYLIKRHAADTRVEEVAVKSFSPNGQYFTDGYGDWFNIADAVVLDKLPEEKPVAPPPESPVLTPPDFTPPPPPMTTAPPPPPPGDVVPPLPPGSLSMTPGMTGNGGEGPVVQTGN